MADIFQVPDYKDHPFYKHITYKSYRPPASHRSNYSTASGSTAGGKSHRSNLNAVDDFFNQEKQGKKTHEQLKQEKFMEEFYEKQRAKNLKPAKNVCIPVQETDLQRMLRQNRQLVGHLPDDLREYALKVLDEEVEVKIQTDQVLEDCAQTKKEIHQEIVKIATALYEVMEAEKQFSKKMDSIILEHYGTEEEQKKNKIAPSPFKKPVKKVIAFGKISIKKEK